MTPKIHDVDTGADTRRRTIPMPTPTNRYYVTSADAFGSDLHRLTVTLTAIGPFSYDEVQTLMNGQPVVIVKADDEGVGGVTAGPSSPREKPARRRTTTVPGSSALHAIITPTCRLNRGDGGALDEAYERVLAEYEAAVLGWEQAPRQPTFHLVLTVERPS